MQRSSWQAPMQRAWPKRDKIIKANPILEHFTVADLRTAWANATSDAAIEPPDEAVSAAPLSNAIVVLQARALWLSARLSRRRRGWKGGIRDVQRQRLSAQGRWIALPTNDSLARPSSGTDPRGLHVI
jgi:hypothetical protein